MTTVFYHKRAIFSLDEQPWECWEVELIRMMERGLRRMATLEEELLATLLPEPDNTLDTGIRVYIQRPLGWEPLPNAGLWEVQRWPVLPDHLLWVWNVVLGIGFIAHEDTQIEATLQIAEETTLRLSDLYGWRIKLPQRDDWPARRGQHHQRRSSSSRRRGGASSHRRPPGASPRRPRRESAEESRSRPGRSSASARGPAASAPRSPSRPRKTRAPSQPDQQSSKPSSGEEDSMQERNDGRKRSKAR